MHPDEVLYAHNVHNGSGKPAQAADAYLKQMDELGATVGVLTEARALVPHLRGRRGLFVAGETPVPRRPSGPVDERGDTVIVASTDRVRRSRVAVMTRTWVVRKYMRWHTPRRDQVIRLDGPVRGVRGVHLPPGGPSDRLNGASWSEQMTKALRWAGKGGCRVILGDVNANRATVRAFIARYSGPNAQRVHSAAVDGHGVDLCIVVGGTLEARALDRAGSDHRRGLYAVAAGETTSRKLRRWLRRVIRAARR